MVFEIGTFVISVLLAAGIVGMVGRELAKLIKKRTEYDWLDGAVGGIVHWIEVNYKDMPGPDKLKQALKRFADAFVDEFNKVPSASQSKYFEEKVEEIVTLDGLRGQSS